MRNSSISSVSSFPSTSLRTPSISLSGRMRNLANLTRPNIDIVLHNQDESPAWVTTYASRDTIKGVASITAPSATKFDNLEIAFHGFTKTFVDKVGSVSAVHGRSEAFHQFLKLVQPIDDSEYPQPRVLEAGRTYQFPFTFVVPDQMLISSCRHKIANPLVKDAHLQLPPSMGDAELAGQGGTLLDDMSPEMARISYGIKVTLTRLRERDSKPSTVAEKCKKVRVVPSVEEQPPVDVDPHDEDYVLRAEKSIRKGMFKSKTGKLVIEAAQPRPLRLRHPKSTDTSAISTVATIVLRWDPADPDAKPPKLGRLANRLKVNTYYASAPRANLPTKREMVYDVSQGLQVESLNLSSRCMASAQWERHEPHTDPSELAFRRGSAGSISNYPCPAPSNASVPSNPFWTAQLLVPIELPRNKSFMPSFHSCLISRVYILDMQLNVQAPVNGAGVSSTVTLKLPLQISSEGNDWSNPNSPLASYAELEEEGDDPLRPRNIAPPPNEYLQTSTLGRSPPGNNSSAPPDYSYFAPSGGFVPVIA